MKLGSRLTGKNRSLVLGIAIMLVVSGFVLFFGQQASIIKTTTAIQFDSPPPGATMSTGTLSLTVKFYPQLATQNMVKPAGRAWRFLVESVYTTGTLVKTERKTTVFDEGGNVDQSNRPFTITKSIEIVSNRKHIVTAYMLVYDEHLDYLMSLDGDEPPPYVPIGSKAVYYSITSPATGEKVFYNVMNFYVEAGETPAEEVTSVSGDTGTPDDGIFAGSGFELLPLLLTIPIIIAIKKKRDE